MYIYIYIYIHTYIYIYIYICAKPDQGDAEGGRGAQEGTPAEGQEEGSTDCPGNNTQEISTLERIPRKLIPRKEYLGNYPAECQEEGSADYLM